MKRSSSPAQPLPRLPRLLCRLAMTFGGFKVPPAEIAVLCSSKARNGNSKTCVILERKRRILRGWCCYFRKLVYGPSSITGKILRRADALLEDDT